jgi:predicted ATPase/class 3 adenylate cyclase
MGTVTLLFTDIEGSTRLLRQLGPDDYGGLLTRHHAIMRAAIDSCSGVEIKTEGDSFFVLFPRAADAILAATQAQRALAQLEWPGISHVGVRMGIHTGDVRISGGEYVGIDIHRAARISAAAHGGQVVLSAASQAIVGQELPTGVSLRDLGEHRLKDIDEPEHLFQLVIGGLPSEFPPLRAQATRFELLPPELSSFIGRDDLLTRARAALGSTRLLTLTGPGGTGKTRLALRLGRLVADEYADGVAFVSLAPISDPDLVMSTIRVALGVAEQPGRTALETVADRLSGREVLIVLDNFEQVAEAAPFVSRLLERATELTLIVTSRVALRLTGEQEYPVPPLDVPVAGGADDLASAARGEAVTLFAERARAIVPDFELTSANIGQVVEICRRLDGLPLAIELAASRVKHLPLGALLARLEKSLDVLRSSAADRSDRQRTLRGAIAWSYELLGPAQQSVFRKLAIFVGGWSLADATAVVDPGASELDLLDELGALVDHSLIRQVGHADEPRFTMLETIREFGRELLLEADELEACTKAHADRFFALVEEAEPKLTAGREWPDALEAEHDNIRAALGWLTERDAQSGLLMAGRLWRFWHLRGHLREGADVLSTLLAKADAAAPTMARARALIGLAGLAYWQLNYQVAQTSYEEAIAIANQLGDEQARVEILYSVAYVRAIGGQYDAAIRDFRAAQELYQKQGNELMATWALEAIGMTQTIAGNHASAIRLLDESAARFEALGDAFGIRNTLAVETRALMRAGRLEDAASFNRRLLALGLEVADLTSISQALQDAASLAAVNGDLESAAILTGAAQRIVDETGGQPPPELVNRIEAMPALESGLDPARLKELLADGRKLSAEEAVEVVLGTRPVANPD